MAKENAALQQRLDDLETRGAALEAASANSAASAQLLKGGLLPGIGVLLASLGLVLSLSKGLVWFNRRGDALNQSKGGGR